MYARLRNYLTDSHARQRMSIALAKGTVGRQLRGLNLTLPPTWEFSGFSQNGEDGIIEVLRTQLIESSNCYLEIGAADGVQNNTTWLAVVAGLHGVMVEGDPKLAATMARVLSEFCVGSRFVQQFVTLENVADVLALLPRLDPDVFSLDIDGNDYHIAQALLQRGLRPRIISVEYNSVFGPQREMTVPYRDDFSLAMHPTRLYYGASLAAWHKLFGSMGYRFVTVERNGVNAFFVDPAHFPPAFIDIVRGLEYAENRYQALKHGVVGDDQFALIASQPFENV
jgi:hypothetical protein